MREIPQTQDEDYEREILSYISDAITESEGFVRAQPDFGCIEKSIKATRSSREESLGAGSGGAALSTVRSNHIAKAEAQLVSAMTDTRNFMEYRTFNPRFTNQTQILGKISLHIWLNRLWDMRWADLIRNNCTGASAYAHQVWNSDIMDLDFQVEDVRDVLPIRPSDNYTIQTAAGVIVRRERTVNYMKAKYSEHADEIVPDRDGSVAGANNSDTRYKRLMDRLGSPFHQRLYGTNKPAVEIQRIPTVDEYTVYLDDRSVNKAEKTLYMGNWHLAPKEGCKLCQIDGTPHSENNWSYKVEKGQRIYPNKRLIVATNSKVLYDNTSPYWHGKYPLTKLTLQPVKDSWIGKGLLWDALPLQKFLDKILRLFDNHFQKWQQPDLIADKNVTAMSEWNKINTARAGLKLRVNPTMGKPPELRYPDVLPAYVFSMLEWCVNEIGTITGAHDVSQLTQLNQLPSADSIDSIMQAMTPEVRMRSRILEAFMREFGEILSYNIAQFYTVGMRMAILGPGGVTLEDFDYDPGSLIPDHVHASDFDESGNVTPEAMARGPLPRYDRAKEVMRQLTMHIAPGSLLTSSEMMDKMMYLQLARMGAMDFLTLLEKMGIPNAEQVLQRLAAQAQMGMAPDFPVGRPPSGQQPPQMQPRTDGTGGVKVSESG